KTRTYTMLAGLGVFLAISLILYRNNRQKQKTNKVLETTLTNLKSTQALLIQSEKMASLGELTAGIAHEIQNPLNFVNNFSEVNGDLIKELKNELINNNLEEIKSIANDIESNSEKINHHGKRAESIVRGMLQHSRKSTGTKDPTDINALADEYMRLSYHGLRAKDKSFNAAIKMDLDPTMPLVNVIPQDIGRVLLNLFNNAFWAVAEKSKNPNLSPQPLKGSYEPLVKVSTRFISSPLGVGGNNESNKTIEISISDNGSGIPASIKEKIFQPFFTTKPTGQGTGLGLSLAYDIIKAHSGIINMNSNKEGSTFQILLPIQ
ncbi:MAG: ATP-binding protein, partial [Saprospiraceae bacterium]